MTLGDRPRLLVPVCVIHPKRETGVRCSKCGDPICPRCMIQTPVGMRCRQCAQLRRLPQFEISPWILARSTTGGLVVSLVAWTVVAHVIYLRFFLSIFVGIAIAEVMSRLALRRDNRVLEIAAVLNVVAGFLIAEIAVTQVRLSDYLSLLNASSGLFISLVIPVIIASAVAVVKLR